MHTFKQFLERKEEVVLSGEDMRAIADEVRRLTSNSRSFTFSQDYWHAQDGLRYNVSLTFPKDHVAPEKVVQKILTNAVKTVPQLRFAAYDSSSLDTGNDRRVLTIRFRVVPK